MLAAPLGAMVGMGFSQLWDWSKEKSWAGFLLIAAVLVTLGFQFFATYQYNKWSLWMLIAGVLFVTGINLMVVRKRGAFVTIIASMMVIPMYWTGMTVAVNPNINLPTAYQGGNQQTGDERARPQGDGPNSNVNEEMLAYLEANTADMKYLVAVPSSQQGSGLVLATGRPVLFMGGFSGQDEVVTANDIAAIVANGELRYILYGGDRGAKQDIAAWLKSSCAVMLDFSEINSGNDSQQGAGNQPLTLYMCR